MSEWVAMINGVQPALAGLDMNMPGFIGYVSPHFWPDESLISVFYSSFASKGVGPQNDPEPLHGGQLLVRCRARRDG